MKYCHVSLIIFIYAATRLVCPPSGIGRSCWKCRRTSVSTDKKWRSGRFLKRRLQSASASSAVAKGSIKDRRWS